MLPYENGRHCNRCSTTVTDFSGLSDEEVQNFFRNNNYQPVCGHFRNTQLDRIQLHIPAYVMGKPIAFWKKFLVIFLVCFGSQLFPFDTFIGNNTSLYAQTTGNKQQKRKKKEKKYPKVKAIKIDPHWVNGFIAIEPIDNKIKECPSLQKISDSAASGDTLNTITATPAAKDNNKDMPGESLPMPKMDFILPAVFTLRRKKRT